MKKRYLLLLAGLSTLALAFGPCDGDDDPTPTKDATVSGTQDGSTNPTGSIMTCQRVCQTTDDCCTTPPCDQQYPSMKCVDGSCKNNGCANNAACAVIPGTECIDIGSSMPKVCGFPCTKDEECASHPGMTTCIDGKLCGATASNGQCTSDADCASWGAATNGHDKCSNGYCICSSDAKCQEALGAATNATWKCAKEQM